MQLYGSMDVILLSHSLLFGFNLLILTLMEFPPNKYEWRKIAAFILVGSVYQLKIVHNYLLKVYLFEQYACVN